MKKYLLEIECSNRNTQRVLSFVKETLTELKLKNKQINKGIMLSEEAFISLINTTSEDEIMQIVIRRIMGNTTIELSCKGQKYEAAITGSVKEYLDTADNDENTESIIRNMIISSNAEIVKTKFRHNKNYITLTVGEPGQKLLFYTTFALVLGIIVGLLFKLFLPTGINGFINDVILTPIKTIFLNALSMITVPVIFFSLAACVSSYTDISELGKIGGKVTLFYVYTTFGAILLGFILNSFFSPGEFGQFAGMVKNQPEVTTASINFVQTIVNIIPTNLIGAFLYGDPLQIIFLSILFGIGAVSLGKKSEPVAEFFNSANKLFLHLANCIINFLPVLVFASMAALLISIDLSSLQTLGKLILINLFATICIVVFYLANVLIFTRTNPIIFLKKVFPAWLNGFALSSSNAAMPYTMKICHENLKIHPKLYSFSIPLGSTVNMDGLSIFLAISIPAIAKLFGVELSTSSYISLLFSIVLLSFGAPAIPGSAAICETILLAQFGIPIEALTILIPLNTILDPIRTADNILGDTVGTYIIAKKSNYMQNN